MTAPGHEPDSVDGVVSTKLVSRIEHMVFGSKSPTRIEVQRTSAYRNQARRKQKHEDDGTQSMNIADGFRE